MQALATVAPRYAGTEGERAMLHAVRERLPDGVESKIEGFVGHTSPGLVLGLHVVLVLALGVIGFWFPRLAAVLCALVTLSLVGEGLGRFSLLRALFPKSPSYNLVIRRPAEDSLGAVVLATALDVPAWRPPRRSWLRFRPLQVVVGAALVVDAMLVLRSLAEPWGPRTLELYVMALVVLACGIAAVSVALRTGEGSDDCGGPAMMLELVRRLAERAPPGVDLWFAFTGCGHAFQGGMHAFLALHDKSLPDPSLVVAFDAPARQPLRAGVSEGPLLAQHHRPTGPGLVERLRWAGVFIPPLDRGGATDARAALVRGYRALSLNGGDGVPSADAVERAADIAETLVRWYGEDLARVADVRPSLQDLARATEKTRAPDRRRRRAGEPDPEPSDAARGSVGEAG